MSGVQAVSAAVPDRARSTEQSSVAVASYRLPNSLHL